MKRYFGHLQGALSSIAVDHSRVVMTVQSGLHGVRVIQDATWSRGMKRPVLRTVCLVPRMR